MLTIRITLQTVEGREVVVFSDEVTSERLCSTLSIAENTLRLALGALQTDALIREYIGAQMVKCVNVGRTVDSSQTSAIRSARNHMLHRVTSKTGRLLGRLRERVARTSSIKGSSRTASAFVSTGQA